MKILLTGASSFTGMWMATALAKAGHQVTATFRGSQENYTGQRAVRVAKLKDKVNSVWNAGFGDSSFLDLISSESFDILCHHGADTENYRSEDFDALGATARNTHNLRKVLQTASEKACRNTIVTGSVFEPFEGEGDSDHRAFSPYGISKHFTFELFRYEAFRLGSKLGKFVIPNPFGPFEDEGRFTSYLAKEWAEGKIPSVRTPLYIRDNIHVKLLALAFVSYCERFFKAGDASKAAPSGYAESQGAFTQRFARELGNRLGRPLEVMLPEQTQFQEPLVRTNSSPAAAEQPSWNEAKAWDETFEYYAEKFLRKK